MSDLTTSQLAEMLGCPLPDNYLQLLNNYPPQLVTAMRAIDDSESEGRVSEVELMESLSMALELNLEARGDSLVRPDGIEIAWPDQFLIIGESGAGDYFCIDAAGDVEGVMRYDHQAVEFEVIADSLNEYVEMLTETFVDEEIDER